MHVKIKLIALTIDHAQLQLMLADEGKALPSKDFARGNPDTVAASLASEFFGCAEGVRRHGFLSPDETGTESLTLVYIQLLTEEKLQCDQAASIGLMPVGEADNSLNNLDTRILNDVVESLKADLEQVMHSRLNKRGLVHLLALLPDIFDHKELAAAYYALTGEKPSSPLMLARMMLDRYTMGSGERQREVKGRDLIEEYEPEAPDFLGEKWQKNKDLYRTGGPKAKRLYRKKSVE